MPSYTADFSAASFDVTLVLIGLIAVALIIFGGRNVMALLDARERKRWHDKFYDDF